MFIRDFQINPKVYDVPRRKQDNFILDTYFIKRSGKPIMVHKELDFGGDDLNGMLERQIFLETEGINKYQEAD
ncbi:Uncharacterised protein [uncultured archaeon]|nr:Uncharacterised protein [uncultured archaeon]